MLKLANHPGEDSEIRNDHEKHISVIDAFKGIPKEFRSDIDIPNVLDDPIGPDSKWFRGSEVSGHSYALGPPKHGFFTSRIYPIPKAVRAALVDVYAPPGFQEKESKKRFLDGEEQTDCLVRVYLGRQRREEAALQRELHASELPSPRQRDGRYWSRYSPIRQNYGPLTRRPSLGRTKRRQRCRVRARYYCLVRLILYTK